MKSKEIIRVETELGRLAVSWTDDDRWEIGGEASGLSAFVSLITEAFHEVGERHPGYAGEGENFCLLD